MKPKLLILFQVCIVLIPEVKTSRHYPVNFTDKISYTGRLERHTGCVVNEEECDNLCFHYHRCKSFFYHNESGVCQLHSNTFTTSSQLPESPGWTYHGAASDCYDIKVMGYTQDGEYQITLLNGTTQNVYCLFGFQNDSYAWTVFQRRYDGSVDFYRTWNEYASGFGDALGEYWLGNQILHELTSQRSYVLHVDLQDFNGTFKYAEYSTFQMSSEATYYTLTVGGYTGDAGEALNYHNGIQFYTKDRPDPNNCVLPGSGGGAWWYNDCYASNLNGVYNDGRGMSWAGFHGPYVSLKSSLMMIRRSISSNNLFYHSDLN